MKLTSLPLFPTAASAILFLSVFAFCQEQPTDSGTVRELLREKGYSMTDSAARAILKNMQARVSPYGRRDLKDTAGAKQDTAEAQAKDSTAELSTYENLIRNHTIDPDSIVKTLTPFGHEIFRNAKPPSFTAEDYQAVPADYAVGSGDEVNILLWGRINEEYHLKIERDGSLDIPHMGPVSVAGLPFSAMQKAVLDRMQSIEGVQASVTLGRLHSVSIYIIGEVKSPGMYTVSALSNVTNALFAAGGPTRRGSLRAIQLKRNGGLVATIDFYDILLSAKDNTTHRVKAGDVVVVPLAKNMVAVAGNVRRSALYEIKEGARLKDVLTLAGGLTPAAWSNRIQIERFHGNQYRTVLDAESQKNNGLPDCEIRDGDIVKVFPVMVKDKNTVSLSGNVLRPGKYEYKEGMRVSDLLPAYESLLPETYLDYAMIMRQEPPSYVSRMIPFNLKTMMESRDTPDNLALEPRDSVVVYPRDYFEPERSVSVAGAVTAPGKQKLLENMKIRDLVIKAGGLLEEASMDRGELYRRVYNGEAVSTEKVEFSVERSMRDDPQDNLPLKKFDMVFIRNRKGWEQQKKVVLKGEITYPGQYVLLEGETLGKLIDRAGGFTAEAYLPSAILTRPSVRQLEKNRSDEYLSRLEGDAVKFNTELLSKSPQPGDVQGLMQQQQLLLGKLKNAEPLGRVVIDLTNRNVCGDFILEDGDSLFVPRELGTVSVIGEVYNPATFRYDAQLQQTRRYVELAGGFKENADRKNVYIFKANGSIVTRKSAKIMDCPLSPGDVVVIPQQVEFTNPYKTFLDAMDAVGKVSAVLVSILAIVVLSRQ